jgi:hypothetical protein
VYAKRPEFELRGGFGLWQVEPSSIKDSFQAIEKDPRKKVLCGGYLSSYDESIVAWKEGKVEKVAKAITCASGDPLACLLAYLHYDRVGAPWPIGQNQAAKFWKKHYNTAFGRGSEDRYLEMWRVYCERVVGSWGRRKGLVFDGKEV